MARLLHEEEQAESQQRAKAAAKAAKRRRQRERQQPEEQQAAVAAASAAEASMAAHETAPTTADSQLAPHPSAATATPAAAAAVQQGNLTAQPPGVDSGPDDLEQLMQLLGVGASSSDSREGWGEECSGSPEAATVPEPPTPLHLCRLPRLPASSDGLPTSLSAAIGSRRPPALP